MRNDILQEIYERAEELEHSVFFPADFDWQTALDNFSMPYIEESIRAMKLVCVKDGVIVDGKE